MKVCPFCREEIRDDALKCRYCQSMLLSVGGAPEEKPFTISIDQRLKSSVALLFSILSAMMTARDILTLAEHIYTDFPEYYHYFGEKEFTYNNIKQGNRNPLLYKDLGVDGLKTGHLEVSGFGLVASAKSGDRRIFMAGGPTRARRSRSASATSSTRSS